MFAMNKCMANLNVGYRSGYFASFDGFRQFLLETAEPSATETGEELHYIGFMTHPNGDIVFKFDEYRYSEDVMVPDQGFVAHIGLGGRNLAIEWMKVEAQFRGASWSQSVAAVADLAFLREATGTQDWLTGYRTGGAYSGLYSRGHGVQWMESRAIVLLTPDSSLVPFASLPGNFALDASVKGYYKVWSEGGGVFVLSKLDGDPRVDLSLRVNALTDLKVCNGVLRRAMRLKFSFESHHLSAYLVHPLHVLMTGNVKGLPKAPRKWFDERRPSNGQPGLIRLRDAVFKDILFNLNGQRDARSPPEELVRQRAAKPTNWS